jgi:hypothetical protein
MLPMAAKTALTAFAAMVFSGCVTDPETVDLSAFKAKWKRMEPAAYQYHVKRPCECWPEDVEVRATRDSVLSIHVLDAVQFPILERQDFSIDNLFAEVEQVMARKYATRSLSFDEDFGFPDTVHIDFDKQVADEEYSLVISDFHTLDTLTGDGR